MIPPWTGATSNVNYPLMTVSDGSWTSTTKAPIAVSEYVFEIVTLTVDTNDKAKRAGEGFTSFWPIPATTPSWPDIIFTGPNGQATTTAPSGTFPTPPSSIGPDAPDPPIGSWPKRFMSHSLASLIGLRYKTAIIMVSSATQIHCSMVALMGRVPVIREPRVTVMTILTRIGEYSTS